MNCNRDATSGFVAAHGSTSSFPFLLSHVTAENLLQNLNLLHAERMARRTLDHASPLEWLPRTVEGVVGYVRGDVAIVLNVSPTARSIMASSPASGRSGHSAVSVSGKPLRLSSTIRDAMSA